MNLINFEGKLSDLSNNSILTKEHRTAAFLSLKLMNEVVDLLGLDVSTDAEELVKAFQAYVHKEKKGA